VIAGIHSALRVLCGIVLASCTASPMRNPQTSSRPAADTLLRVLIAPHPILSQAENVVAIRCMREAGFEVGATVVAPPVADSRYLVGAPLSLTDAREHGYGLAPPRASLVPTALRSLPPSQRSSAAEALASGRMIRVTVEGRYSVGAARHGCLAEGRIAVHGSLRNYLRTWYGPQIIRSELRRFLPRVVADATVQVAMKGYGRCMKLRGYDVASPEEARSWAERNMSRHIQGVSIAERRMALADARCQLASGIFPVFDAALVVIGGRYLEGERDAMEDLLVLLQDARERARRILEGTRDIDGEG